MCTKAAYRPFNMQQCAHVTELEALAGDDSQRASVNSAALCSIPTPKDMVYKFGNLKSAWYLWPRILLVGHEIEYE